MKKLLQPVSFLILTIFLSAKISGQQIAFQKYYVDSVNTFVRNYELLQTNDHGYLMGNVRSLVKTDSLGQMEWYKQYNYTGFTSALFYSIDKTFDGGYITAGNFSLLLKLDSNYMISWKKEFTNLSGVFNTIRETMDHGFIIGGSLPLNVNNYLLIKTDSDGIVQWSKIYPSQTGGEAFKFLSIAGDGGFLLCGYGSSVVDTSSNYADIKVLKVDSMGNPQWSKHYNSNVASESFCYHIIAVSDGGFVLTGSRNLNKFLLKIDSVGNILWGKLYEAPVHGHAVWVEETKDQGLIVTGMHNAPGFGFCTQLFKTDSVGNLLWARFLATYAGAWGGCVKQTEDGGFAVGSTGSDNGFSGIYFIKTDSLGHTNNCLEDTSVMIVTTLNDTVISVLVTDSNLNVTSLPSTINPIGSGWEFTNCPPVVGVSETNAEKKEIEIYPNPFSEKIKVQSSMYKVGAKKSMMIYDLMGETVYKKELSSNKTEEELNLSFLHQGVYFLNVKGNDKSYTRKIVKM